MQCLIMVLCCTEGYSWFSFQGKSSSLYPPFKLTGCELSLTSSQDVEIVSIRVRQCSYHCDLLPWSNHFRITANSSPFTVRSISKERMFLFKNMKLPFILVLHLEVVQLLQGGLRLQMDEGTAEMLFIASILLLRTDQS